MMSTRGEVERGWLKRRSWWRRLLRPPLSVYHNPHEKDIESQHPLGRWNLYIGGAGNQVPGYVNVDLVALPGVDVLCNAEQLPFQDNQFTRVECDAVLEHVERPELVVAEIHRCLRPGGLAHFVVPFCHPFHEYPKDFRRYTPEGLKLLCRGFDIVGQGWRSGPTATLLVFGLEYAKGWCNSRLARRTVHLAVGWLLFPLRYLDAIFFRKATAGNIGNHHYLYACKPAGRCGSEIGAAGGRP